MKTELSLQELATEITRRADKKEDMIGDTRAIGYEPDRNALVIDGREFAVNDHAHGQIAEHTGIPAAYYKRMRQEAPRLLVTTSANGSTSIRHGAWCAR